jgi:parallel beta-helix repeat protein
MKARFVIGIVAGIIILPTSAFAATIQVPADQPTIQAGINAASDGDIVLVADGTYTGDGNKNLNFSGKAITVISESGPDNCIIDCEGDGIGFYFENGEGTSSVVSGFTIIDGRGYYAGGIYCNNSSPIIENCKVIGNLSTDFGGGISCVSSSPTITNCEISQNSAGINGGGIYCQNASAIITSSKINRNTAVRPGGSGGGICFRDSDGSALINSLVTDNSAINSGGVYCYGSSVTILNTTITRNGSTVGGGLGCDNESSPSISNCILWNNTPEEISQDSSSSSLVTYCDVKRNYTGEGNFYADPLFVGAENGDYHLSIGSPCIYAATAASAPDTDLEGHLRPQGYGYDIGAYEMTGYAESRPIINSFTCDPTEIYVPFEVNFVCIASDPDGAIVSYVIDYGDGSENGTNSTGVFTHTYNSGGIVYARCMVTDNAGITVNSVPIVIRRHGDIHVPSDYPTIQAALDAALDGDTVVVADGTYTGEGNKNLDFQGKAITVHSENGPETCIIDCEGDGRGFNFHSGEAANSVVWGFTVKNGRMSRAGGISCENSSPTIANCIVTNNLADSANSGGIGIYNSSPIITGCRIIGNTADRWGGGIGCSDSSPAITNCIISGNESDYSYGGGICCNNASPAIKNCILIRNSAFRDGGGIYCRIDSSPTITNCTLSGNSAEQGGGLYSAYSSSPTIANSILWADDPDEISVFGADIDVRHSNVQGGWEGEGNRALIPYFMNPAMDDYHLKPYSPCIGVGTSDGVPYTDIEGNPRPDPVGSNPDLGAYENSRGIPEVPTPETLDVFGLEVGNKWTYRGTKQGQAYTMEREITSTGKGPFPVEVYVVEIKENGVYLGTEIYEHTGNQMKLWGITLKGGHTAFSLNFSQGLLAAQFPAQVGDHLDSSTNATIPQLPSCTFDVSLTVDVINKVPVILNFGTVEAYKAHIIMNIRGSCLGDSIEDTASFYWWVVPHLGIVKDQGTNYMVELTSFAIGGGIIMQDSDADGDNLTDYLELFSYNTNWLYEDTDSDALNDGDEVNLYGTDPVKSDTDDDGLDDGEEINRGTDPADPDTDDDGLNDRDEVNTYGTDPLDTDTDDDALTDGDEVNTYGTDPLDADMDDDGLNDGDEIGRGTDPLDPDTDADQLPDGWEVEYGLDPLSSLPPNGTTDDPDGDGLTNLEEYNLGRHPTNYEPDKPVLLSPLNAGIDVSLTPTLLTDAFSDPDGDDHAKTRWQVSRVQGDFSDSSLVMDALSDFHLTSFALPSYILSIDTDYYWRAKFHDDGNAASEWSDEWFFRTVPTDPSDPDGDGVPEDQEMNDASVDLDENGTPDMNQADMKCVNTVVGDAQVSVKQGTNVASIDSLSSLDLVFICDDQNRPDEMPIGLINFRLTVNNPGDTAEVTIYISKEVGNKWYKWDPLNGWQDFTTHATFSADRTSLTLQLTDGGEGDLDGVANGVINDPSGPNAMLGDGNGDVAGGGGGG